MLVLLLSTISHSLYQQTVFDFLWKIIMYTPFFGKLPPFSQNTPKFKSYLYNVTLRTRVKANEQKHIYETQKHTAVRCAAKHLNKFSWINLSPSILIRYITTNYHSSNICSRLPIGCVTAHVFFLPSAGETQLLHSLHAFSCSTTQVRIWEVETDPKSVQRRHSPRAVHGFNPICQTNTT